ncbi:hypothetical protein Zmor_027203 [Zophobas morio]|uniref:Uncharacterized protein n=1 Tax=Zophobas morio TaxID=2755281 RepID=A0AA38M1U3_9CUCU|nr:hypothetical protein Zmor_027203 [Zophobas morio]
MSRDEVHVRDRLLFLAECSNPHKPFNVKRKSTLTKQGSKSGPKLSVQDFVRMDPGYTPDIEHLVFPSRKRNPQQVAPINPTPGKTRSRLAEMFALSRHLQQRSADRDSKRSSVINRSVDSVFEGRGLSISGSAAAGARNPETVRRWVSAAEEPVRQNTNTTRISPAAESDMAAARGPNVSVLHLRSTAEPWEPRTSSVYTTASRTYPTKTVPTLTKHQSLSGPYKWANSSNFHSVSEVNNSSELFVGGTVNRELSPVRWCDREVDGVYLGRSGWVQVQQRSLDENRRTTYTPLQQSRRTGIKLADYHFNSEPGKAPEGLSLPEPKASDTTARPIHLTLQAREVERRKTPSPQPETFSPPPVTPIISPPPAFQDKDKNKKPSLVKTRTFFGKTPFLPRSNAIDSDEITPPASPKTAKWKSMSMPTQMRKISQPPQVVPQVVPELKGFGRIPQTKSLEDTTATRRSLFVQRHGESSSSSSSSMGFRSLDSCVNRPAMPRLSENTDSSIDVYEDADEEDNNSSSINISMVNMNMFGDFNKPKEKISPSNRPNRLQYYRGQLRKAPTVSEGSKVATVPCVSPGSSSSSSNEFPSRSPMGSTQQIRRITPSRLYQPIKIVPPPPPPDDPLQRVRRSRSLQLPDKKTPQNYPLRVSPQHPDLHRPVIKMGTQLDRTKRFTKIESSTFTEEDLLREAEVVTNYLYGTRTRAAAQALLMHRYSSMGKEEKPKEAPKPHNNGLTVYFVPNPKKERPKVLHRGSTTPNLPISKHVFGPQVEPTPPKNPCTSDTCDFWPHCAHRESLNREFIMRSSQSYPTHQRSLDSTNKRRVSPSKPSAMLPQKEFEKKTSPVTVPFGTVSSSSSSSDVWLTTSDRTVGKNAKGSGASTPLEDLPPLSDKGREMILTRPGSAPTEERSAGFLESQQRSMSLPKSFLSGSHQQGYVGLLLWSRQSSGMLLVFFFSLP